MIGEQRRRTAGMNKQNRPFIFETFLTDTVNQTRHRFSGIHRIKQNAFQPRQLSQPNFENVVGLSFGKGETRHQRRFRFIRFADDADHLVDMEEDDVPPFENVNTVQRLGEAEVAAPTHRSQAEAAPFAEQVDERFLAGTSIESDRNEVDWRGALQAGVREQQGDEFLAALARTDRFEDEADVVARVALRVLDASPATSCQAEIDRLGVELGVREPAAS